MIKCCNFPIIREGEKFCRNCGSDVKYEPKTSYSNNSQYYGEVVEKPRGYYIIIIDSNDSDVYFSYSQKSTKAVEEKLGKTKQELADLIANHTISIKSHFNGKYETQKIKIDWEKIDKLTGE